MQRNIELKNTTDLVFTVHSVEISYDVGESQYSFIGGTTQLEPIDNKINPQILVDRTSIEIFSNDGQLSMNS